MPQSRIAIVGASVRAAAQSALRAGYSPVAADLFADADLYEVCPATRIANYPDGFCDWLAQQDVDGWFYTGALENYPDLIDQMVAVVGNTAPLWGNAGDVLHQIRSPLRLQQTLNDAGLLFPETQTTQPLLDGKWLAKTCRGSSGCGVRRFELHPAEPSLEPQDTFFQRFIEGTPISALFFATGDNISGNSAKGNSAKLIGITKQLIDVAWTHAKPFQYAGSIGPWKITHQVQAEIERTGNVLAQQFNLVGLFGVDMILQGDQAWTLEVNPRYTAAFEVVERFTTTPHQAAGKAILFAPQAIEVLGSLTNWALQRSHTKPWPEIGDIPTAGTQIEASQPVLTVFAQADCIDEVEHRLRVSIEEVEAQLYE